MIQARGLNTGQWVPNYAELVRSLHDMIFSEPMAPHDKVTLTKEGSESFQATKEKNSQLDSTGSPKLCETFRPYD